MSKNKMKHLRGVVGFLCLLLFAGCSSTANNASTIDPNTGRHAAGWASADAHGAKVKTGVDGFSSCQSCHGRNFSGGISKISCFSCHGVDAPHAPAPWRGGTQTHTTTDTSNAPVCAQCHANGALSSVQPASPAPQGTAPGCFNNTLCHAAVGHAAGWSAPDQHGATAKAQPGSSAGFASCETCHSSDFSGGLANTSCFTCHGGSGPHPTSWITGVYTHTSTDTGNAPVCAQCHTNGAHSPIAPPSPAAPAGTAPGCFNNTLCHATPTCGSCHGIPPAGATFPNIAGSHAAHMSLGANVACSACHSGAGSGTSLHQNGAVDVVLDPAFNAKSGAATYFAASQTCTNISCHGGQTTPTWLSGAINVNTQCAACHSSGTTQYNSYNSGHHSTHVSEGIACTTCHDTTKLAAVHFTTLNTTVISAATASATINNAINFNGTTCNPSAGGLTGCHSSHTW
jgi:predicted CxxxxCH...CXXCH cytochrome family protein